jgi:hypothetical protein
MRLILRVEDYAVVNWDIVVLRINLMVVLNT